MPSTYDQYNKQAQHSFGNMSQENQTYLLDYIQLLINRQLSPHSLNSIISNLRQFCLYLQQIHPLMSLVSVKAEFIRHYLSYLNSKSLAPDSINNRLSILKRFFEYLVDEGSMDKTPVLHRYFLKRATRLPRPMRALDIEIFFSNLDDLQYRCIFLLMLRSGLRIGEVCQLKQADISFDDQKLMVHNGKGKVDRIVYFSLEVQNSLLLWLNHRPYESSYCFASRRSTEVPIHATVIRTWMKQHLKTWGLAEKGYTPHSLRHTFATDVLNAGIPLVVLKDLMGHRSMDQTLMYAKLSDQTIRQAYQQACEKLDHSQAGFTKKEVFGG